VNARDALAKSASIENESSKNRMYCSVEKTANIKIKFPHTKTRKNKQKKRKQKATSGY